MPSPAVAAMLIDTAVEKTIAKITQTANRFADAIFDPKAILRVQQIAAYGDALAGTIGETRIASVNLTRALREQMSGMATLPTDYYASFEQLTSIVTAASRQFISLQEGLEFSARGAAVFGVELNRGFGAPFRLTKDALDALIVTGMSTTEQFEQFRRSTGRAGLTSEQFSQIVGKNTLSFLLFGNAISRGIADLESLGVQTQNLISIQKGVVGNLEGTIDTVNQLNMLGAQIDLTELLQLSELGDPIQTFQYLLKTIPEDLMKSSTSFRSLASTLGVDAETFLRAGEQRVRARSDIETKLTQPLSEQQTEVAGKFNNAATKFYQSVQLFSESTAAIALKEGASPLQTAADALGSALRTSVFGNEAAFPMRTPRPAQDLLSVGGGGRVLSTPEGDYEFAKNDTLVAGTKLFSAASLQLGAGDGGTDINIERLSSKIDALISTLASANTVIQIDNGAPQQVPRMSLSAIYTRNERG